MTNVASVPQTSLCLSIMSAFLSLEFSGGKFFKMTSSIPTLLFLREENGSTNPSPPPSVIQQNKRKTGTRGGARHSACGSTTIRPRGGQAQTLPTSSDRYLHGHIQSLPRILSRIVRTNVDDREEVGVRNGGRGRSGGGGMDCGCGW